MFTFTLKDPHFLPHIGCDVDLFIATGESLFITGENGLGKSTLLKRMSESIPNSYLISQIPLVTFYDRSLARYLEVVLKGFSEGINPETFHRLWSAFGLNSKLNRLLSQLSGGERQCVKLATGLAMHESLLLLDEPSQYLDLEKKRILFEQLLELKRQSKSLLIVEHDLSWWKKPSAVLPLKVQERTLVKGDAWTIS